MLLPTPRGIGCHHFFDLATSQRSVTGHPIAIQVAWAPPVTIQTSRVNWCSTGDGTKPYCNSHGYNCCLNCLFVSSFLPSFFHSLFAFPTFFLCPPVLPSCLFPTVLLTFLLPTFLWSAPLCPLSPTFHLS